MRSAFDQCRTPKFKPYALDELRSAFGHFAVGANEAIRWHTTDNLRPNHTHTTPSPHFLKKVVVWPHHTLFQKVWCWCGVGVVWAKVDSCVPP